MSRRGGKRRPVLQLGNSSSKLHRYGYSKEFHSKDKKVSTLVGAYSDSEESDNESDNEQQTVGEPPELENGETADGMTAALPTERGDEGSQNPEAHMDDELKTFLSEIEAIPMPVDMMAASVEQAGETEIHDFPEETRIKEEEPQNNTTTKSKHSYSMFVKGEPEFVNNTKMDATNDKGEQKETETKDLLSEIPIEPTTNWQMVQDETTQYYYYWNIVTNEVTWEIPTEYTQFLLLHKEYEEKLAKFTPEQLQAIKDRAQRLLAKENASKETTTVTASMHDVVTQNDTSLSALSVYGKDDTRELSKRDMVTERLSPRPDSTSDSHHRKHKKEKRSHHKKKHKRKHSDSDSEGSSKRSPKMPDLGAAVLAETVEKTSSAGQKLASIVPYLSDQDDDDNEEETSMPELGPQDLPDSNTSSPPTREGGPEKDTIMPEIGPAIKPAETVLSQDVSAAQSEEAVEIDPSILLLPPPPPPPAEEEKDKYDVDTKRISQRDIESEKGEEINRAVKTQIFSGLLETEMLSSNSDPSSVNEILNAIAHTPLDVVDKGMKAEEMEGKLVPNTTQDLSKLDKGEQKHRHHEIPKVDMFAEDYPPLNSTAQATDYPMDKGEDSSIQDGIDVTEEKIENSGKEKMIVSSEKPKVVEESMEEGELSEASEKDNTISKTLQTGEKELSVAVTKNKSGSVLNIVGYGSDEEEEEGEVKDYEMKEEDKHEKKKKKSKKKDWKKSKKDSKADYSFMDGKLDKEILSKMSDTIDQTISKIVTQTVDQAVSGLAAEKPKGTTQQEDGDIDFEDLDDIDRALEVALEKKLEKKKAALAQVTEREKSNEDVVVTDQAPAVLVSGGDEKAVGVTEDSPAYTSKKSKHDERTTVSMENDEENLKAEIKEMADLALSKLEFLDISTESLSRLQILFIELQTRQTDWVAGGLSSQYFYEQLKVAESLLKQYELSAVPEGWACQWDRANNRYYYRNKQTNRIQWEYPLVEDGSKGDRTASSREESGAKVADAVSEEQHKSRSSGSSRHRKRDEKDRGKYDKRSSSHRYRRKRRRRRDHSTSSNSSEGSQQHRHHHKSKKKKRHRSERSPSVEIMEDIDGMDMDDVEITGASMTQPVSSSQPASNATSPPSATSTIEVTGDGAPPPPSTAPGLTEECTSTEDTSRQVEEEQEEEEEGSKEEESLESASTVVISKPPQIVVPPQIAAAINPSELHSGAELYSASHISATSLPKSSTSQADKALLSSETASETIEGQSGDGDKQSKKKKKDKKPLAAGSSSMMKKKHLSSMVQKWQNVKKEVEKEDRAKELRQAAIRKKIEELK